MVAFALRADGWYLRSDIIWAKPNPMPESVTDRPTKAHEYLFLLSKSRGTSTTPTRSGGAAEGRPAFRSGTIHGASFDNTHERQYGRGRKRQWQPGGPQQALRLDRRNAALPRRPLRHLPAEADRAVCAGRVQPAGLR
jgi:hypothetical protein